MPVALVTGGGTGIGKATVHALVERGWDVALTGRRAAPLEGVVREVGADRAEAVVGDVSDADGAERMVSATVSRFGGLDLLVNNAGVAVPGRLVDTPLEALDQMIAVNLRGPLLATRAAVAPLGERRGCIVNIGSVGGLVSSRVSSVYGATKAAVHHLSTCLARELAPAGIRVNTIVPGPVESDLLDDAAFERGARSTLRNRLGRPEEIARWVAFLADPQSDWVTGALITVDGGFTVGT